MLNSSGLLSNASEYSRCYESFRGVDFSSDHTQVHESRLAYAVNMFKDYQSGQGQALETIVGFRRRVECPDECEIFGIHRLSLRSENVPRVLIHAGKRLYLWHNYPRTLGVKHNVTVTLPEPTSQAGSLRSFAVQLEENVATVVAATKTDGEDLMLNTVYDAATQVLTISRSDLYAGDHVYLIYTEGDLTDADALWTDMNERRSTSFVFNNRLYLIDGKNYLVFDGERVRAVRDAAYVPTTYINIIPSGENADIGTEYEQRNLLSPCFKHTFIADGVTTEFYMNENALEEIVEVKVYGKTVRDYTTDLPNGKITFAEAPKSPKDVEDGAYPEFYAGVEITAKKTLNAVSGVTEAESSVDTLITHCTLACVFDNRVFFSGNPAYPNHVFYCGRNLTGYVDPTYFGVLLYMQDGVGTSPITGMIPVADSLMVLKGDTQQDGAVFFHTPTETGDDLQPKIYPSAQGLNGIGCLGACTNFLDDPVFISRLGVEAVGQLSVRYERAIEHRSSLVDAKLVNMDLSRATLEEWNGYLVLLCDGKIFLADSRQRYTHDIGVMQYEWYYLEDIGVWRGQYPEYHYASQIYSELEGTHVHYCTQCKKSAKECTCEDNSHHVALPLMLADAVYYADTDETRNLCGTVANAPDADGLATTEIFDEIATFALDGVTYSTAVYFTVHEVYNVLTGELERYEAYLCENKGNQTGGVFQPATVTHSMEDNLFFGTANGVVCSFNFDKRSESGEIAPQYYAFDDRTIFCGCATKMDCCGIPHLTKNTVKKSTVIKTKSLQNSAAKIKVRTNKKPYEQIARINSSVFAFDGVDFSDFSFQTLEQSLFAVKEKEKKWVEKQYFLYSDEYRKPFALYYISYRYTVAGRYKQ